MQLRRHRPWEQLCLLLTFGPGVAPPTPVGSFGFRLLCLWAVGVGAVPPEGGASAEVKPCGRLSEVGGRVSHPEVEQGAWVPAGLWEHREPRLQALRLRDSGQFLTYRHCSLSYT